MGCSAKPRARKTYREVTYRRSDQLGSPAICVACGCVLAYADKRLTIFNTYAHLTDQPIAHQCKTSGISVFFLVPPTNLYNIVKQSKTTENRHLIGHTGTVTQQQHWPITLLARAGGLHIRMIQIDLNLGCEGVLVMPGGSRQTPTSASWSWPHSSYPRSRSAACGCAAGRHVRCVPVAKTAARCRS